MSSLVNGHKGNVTSSVSSRPDVSSLLLVIRDERNGGRVEESRLVSGLELVNPLLQVHRNVMLVMRHACVTMQYKRSTHLVSDEVAHEILDTSIDQNSDTILNDGDQQVGRSVHDVGLEPETE